MACGEFSLIARYFDRVRSSRLDVELGIGDDCALLNIPEKQTLAISTDTLVAGNHFLLISILLIWLINTGGEPKRSGSDGADPAWLTLALTLPDVTKRGLSPSATACLIFSIITICSLLAAIPRVGHYQ